MDKLEKSPVVVQSNKLIESRYTLSVGEQRLVFAVASMIHPDDVDFYPYEIKIKDLALLLKIDIKNAYRDADKITDQLMSRNLIIQEDDGPLKVGWVSSCKYNTSKGSISFRFDPTLKPYLLLLRREFTQSKLTILAQFQSIYSIRIYQLLKQYKKIGYREFVVTDLKEILGVSKEKYKQFKMFRAWVINQAKKEFEKKDDNGFYQCDLTFDLETIREGRFITKIKFIIKNQRYQESLPFISNEYSGISDEILKELETYGLSDSTAKTYLEDLGEDKTNEILRYYKACLAAGKVKNKGGGYLAFLLKEKITGKSDYETFQKTEIEEKQRQDIEEKKKVEEQTQNRILKLEKTFSHMSEKDQQLIKKSFEESLKPVLLKSFRENGVESILFKEMFLDFVEESLRKEVDSVQRTDS